jgi:hypothetical protein
MYSRFVQEFRISSGCALRIHDNDAVLFKRDDAKRGIGERGKVMPCSRLRSIATGIMAARCL